MLEKYYLQTKISELFKKITFKIKQPNPDDYRNERQALLTYIRGNWYVSKINK